MQPSDELSLTNEQRDECLAQLDQDGLAVLPITLPTELLDRLVHYIDIGRLTCFGPLRVRLSGWLKRLLG